MHARRPHRVSVALELLAAFAAALAILIFSGDYPDPAKYFLIGLLVLATAVGQLWINHPETFRRNSRIGLVFGVMLCHLVIAKLVMVLSTGSDGGASRDFGVLLIPYALAPLVLSVLLGKNHGVYAAIFVSLGSAILFRGLEPVLLVMCLISGFIAVLVTIQVRRRSRLIRAPRAPRNRKNRQHSTMQVDRWRPGGRGDPVAVVP